MVLARKVVDEVHIIWTIHTDMIVWCALHLSELYFMSLSNQFLLDLETGIKWSSVRISTVLRKLKMFRHVQTRCDVQSELRLAAVIARAFALFEAQVQSARLRATMRGQRKHCTDRIIFPAQYDNIPYAVIPRVRVCAWYRKSLSFPHKYRGNSPSNLLFTFHYWKQEIDMC